jgi:hypothetical protein
MKRSVLAISALAAAFVSMPAAAAPPGMSDIEEVVAKQQIEELMYRYALYQNGDNPEGYAGLFTDDGQFGPVKGRAALLEMAKNEVVKLHKFESTQEGQYNFGFLRLVLFNPVIDIIDATHAKGVISRITLVPDIDNKGTPTILGYGTYQDEYRKVDGKWLIAKRVPYGKIRLPELGAKLGLGPSPSSAPSKN